MTRRFKTASRMGGLGRRLTGTALAAGLITAGVAVLGSGPAQATGLWAGACTASKLPMLNNGSFENGVNPPLVDPRTWPATKTTPNTDIAS